MNECQHSSNRPHDDCATCLRREIETKQDSAERLANGSGFLDYTIKVQEGEIERLEADLKHEKQARQKAETTCVAVRQFAERINNGRMTSEDSALTQLGVIQKVLELLAGAGENHVRKLEATCALYRKELTKIMAIGRAYNEKGERDSKVLDHFLEAAEALDEVLNKTEPINVQEGEIERLKSELKHAKQACAHMRSALEVALDDLHRSAGGAEFCRDDPQGHISCKVVLAALDGDAGKG